jgi:chemotaxis protein CheX
METPNPQLPDEICDLLGASAGDVFSTLFEREALPVAPREFSRGDGPLIAASVDFVGQVTGVVYLYIRHPFADELARQFLSLPADAVVEDGMVNDVIGELCNMLVGSVKSRLCDSGRICALTMPTTMRGSRLSAMPALACDASRALGFACGSEPFWMELLMGRSK